MMRPLTALMALTLQAALQAAAVVAALRGLVARPAGLLVVTGPTGSGKTTTLHSALGYINQPDRKIWTAEDPVEITQPGLRQVQVNPRIEWTFAKALRSFLRADPDVIMVARSAEGLDSRPGWAGIRAVRERRVKGMKAAAMRKRRRHSRRPPFVSTCSFSTSS